MLLLTNKNQPTPQFYCKSCKKMRKDGYCTCFKRPVNKRTTKCFYHSKHNSIHFEYKSPENLKEIAYENYLREIS
jgi:hypothetical protein